jgi:hypothetical protein
VFSNPKWQQFALILNLAGTALLFYSFQATSSNFRLITKVENSAVAGKIEYSALCVYKLSLMQANAKGGWTINGGPCPDWEHSKAAAVVNIEHPFFESSGFVILLAGFLIQYLAVPQPQTIADLRRQLKLLKAQQQKSQ